MKLRLLALSAMFFFNTTFLFSVEEDTDTASDDVLVNDELIKRYLDDDSLYNPEERFLATTIMGTFSGFVFGSVGSLALYDSNNTDDENTNNLLLFGGILGVGGMATGATIAWIEHQNKKYFTIGPAMLKYTWYGTLAGALLGAMASLPVYATSEETDDILNFTGYGSLIGLTTGFTMFFFRSPDNLNFSTGYSNGNFISSVQYRF